MTIEPNYGRTSADKTVPSFNRAICAVKHTIITLTRKVDQCVHGLCKHGANHPTNPLATLSLATHAVVLPAIARSVLLNTTALGRFAALASLPLLCVTALSSYRCLHLLNTPQNERAPEPVFPEALYLDSTKLVTPSSFMHDICLQREQKKDI